MHNIINLHNQDSILSNSTECCENYHKKIKILVISEIHKNKIYNLDSINFVNQIIDKLNSLYDNFYLFSLYQEEFPKTIQICQNKDKKIDYILVVGCNKTLMYTFYKFQQVTTPPILAFSIEGQSTLYNFGKSQMETILKKFIQKLKNNTISQNFDKITKLQLIKSSQLKSQIFTKNATCQIEINRGMNPALLKMELFLRDKKDKQKRIFISKLWGDGIVISTSYGSVTRSMALNGPIIHKKLQSIILTPSCPLSLKFRPIVLPMDNTQLIIRIQQGSRSGGSIYIDGIKTDEIIKQNEQIIIRRNKELKTVMISGLDGSYQQTLFQNLQLFLSWGQQFSSKNYKEYIKQHNDCTKD